MNKLLYGFDYYNVGDRVVFTALFHIQRGQCCGNGCTNCPYTPKHTKGKVALAEKYLKFKNMNLEEIKKRVEEIQKQINDNNNLTAEEQQKFTSELLQLAAQTEISLSNLKIEQ